MIGSFYRPPNSDLSVLQELEKSIVKAHHAAKNHPLILTGDFNNLPGIDWDVHNTKLNAHDKQQCQCLLDITDDFHLRQLVKEPTRCTPSTVNILDSTKSSFLTNVSVIPGISDHKHATVDFVHKLKRVTSGPKKVFDYRHGNMENFKNDMVNFHQTILRSPIGKASNLL